MKLLNIVISVIGLAQRSTAAPFLSNVEVAPSSFGTDSVFGIARGGGLFGGKGKSKDSVAVEEKLRAESGETFPALSQEEVEEFLGHIPVFAVTDSNGAGVVLKPDNETSVMYFFFSPQMANATLNQLKGTNDELDLKLSAFSLGKIWYKMLNNGGQEEIKLKQPGADDSEAEVLEGGNVSYRLVPDTRDLLGARMLLTMTPEDGEEMKKAGDSMTPELAQKAVEKAMTESPEFKENYNEIPIFLIAQMRMQKPPADGETGEPKTILPMYFSLQTMVGTWQQFMAAQADPETKDMEPAINVMNLHKLVDMMREPSEIDFRSCLLLPPIPPGAGGAGGAAAGAAAAGMGGQPAASPMGGGGTLGDL